MDLNTLDNHHPGTLEVLQELNLSNNPLAGYAPEFEEEDEENENQVVYESKVCIPSGILLLIYLGGHQSKCPKCRGYLHATES